NWSKELKVNSLITREKINLKSHFPYVRESDFLCSLIQLNGPIVEERDTLQNRSFYQTFFTNYQTFF
ncbi:hypothetical protein, partial [Bacillus pseudomycoides]|uniref:hypothetical protein n=1 Tax=Bacillus pseudomycoides TaxID=64104 RepID=UPI002E1BE2EA|nr:hypothetical protein [Bacillus pseudomycoides]